MRRHVWVVHVIALLIWVAECGFTPALSESSRDALRAMTRRAGPPHASRLGTPTGPNIVFDAPDAMIDVQAGGTADDTMIISNDGDSTLHFSNEYDPGPLPRPPTLTFDPEFGELLPGDTQVVQIHYDTTNVAPGSYPITIQVVNNDRDPEDRTQTAPVALNVSASCETFVHVTYPGSPASAEVGDTIRVRIGVGAGSIGGGANVVINRVRFNLDCDQSNLGVVCPDDGLIVSYQGNITTTCGSTWAADLFPGDLLPNQIAFTPSDALVIPANTETLCEFEFDVRIEGRSNDGTPDLIEQVVAIDASLGDAVCDNIPPRAGGATVSSQICICAICDDANPCNGIETCDVDQSSCTAGIPITCDDHDVCTSDTCDPSVAPPNDPCVYTPGAIDCDDGDPSTTDSCDPTEGCQHEVTSRDSSTDVATARTDQGPKDSRRSSSVSNTQGTLGCHTESGCEARIHLSYPTLPRYSALGDVVRVMLTLGPMRHDDGLGVIVNRVRFNLDCNNDNLGINCFDDGATVSYQGQLDSNCGVVWSSGEHGPGDTLPNQVVFTPDRSLQLATGESCTLTFLTKIETTSNDHSFNVIEQVAGVDASLNDATCSGASPRAAGAATTGSFVLCPACDDGNQCNGQEYCDPSAGCAIGPPLECNDGNACTDDRCDPSIYPPENPCIYTDNSSLCDDGNICTDDSCSTVNGCVSASNHSCDGQVKGSGYWRQVCRSRASAPERMTLQDVACTGATCTFAEDTSVSSLCDELRPAPNRDKCEQAEAQLMSLLLNVCRQRVLRSDTVPTRCAGDRSVEEILESVDAILCNPDRDGTSCSEALCLLPEF